MPVDRGRIFFQAINASEANKSYQKIDTPPFATLLASFVAFYSSYQHKKILNTLRPVQIPSGYNVAAGMIINVILGVLGRGLSYAYTLLVVLDKYRLKIKEDQGL